MHSFIIFIADFTPWQQHRLYSACRAYMSVLDPGFDAEALYLDDQRVGWTFILNTDEARRRLIVFFTALIGNVAEEQADGDPAIQRGQDDAPAPFDRSAGVIR